MKTTGLLGRVIIGTLFGVAVFLLIMFTPLPFLVLLVAAWSVLATLEFIKLLRIAEIYLNPWFLSILNVLIISAAWRGWLPGFLIAPLAIVFIAAVVITDVKPRIPVYNTFILIYLGFLPAYLIMLKSLALEHAISLWLVMFPLLLTWTNDTAAWGIGKLFGRHKLTPSLSPNKTWEGFIAGLVCSAALAAPFLKLFHPFSDLAWPYLAVIGIGLGTLSQTGDLFESIFKRAVGIKDTSNILGEHGGFLDRIDSLLFTIPAWYYLVLFYLR